MIARAQSLVNRLRRVDWVIACAVGALLGILIGGLISPPEERSDVDQFAVRPTEDSPFT